MQELRVKKTYDLPCGIGDTVYVIDNYSPDHWVVPMKLEVHWAVVDGIFIDSDSEIYYKYSFRDNPGTGILGENIFLTLEEAKAHMPKGNKYWYYDGRAYCLVFRLSEQNRDEVEAWDQEKILARVYKSSARIEAQHMILCDDWNIICSLDWDNEMRFNRSEYSPVDIKKKAEDIVYEYFKSIDRYIAEKFRDACKEEYYDA